MTPVVRPAEEIQAWRVVKLKLKRKARGPIFAIAVVDVFATLKRLIGSRIDRQMIDQLVCPS